MNPKSVPSKSFCTVRDKGEEAPAPGAPGTALDRLLSATRLVVRHLLISVRNGTEEA